MASVCASTPCEASTSSSAPFAGGQRPGHLVREVDVPRRVDQVQDVLLPVLRRVVQADRVRLDGDAALALEIHRVEDLRLHLARLKGAGDLEEAVGERRLAVVDVRDDREVSDVAWFHAVNRPNSLLSPFLRHAAIAPRNETTETQRHGGAPSQDSAGRPAGQADAHGQDRIEIRTGENRCGSYLDPIMAVPPLRGASRIRSARFSLAALLRCRVSPCLGVSVVNPSS